MGKAMRVLRGFDDALEFWLFDVVLATRKGRRRACALTALSVVTLYAFSGLLLVPNVADVPEAPWNCSPYVEDATWARPSQGVLDAARDFTIAPERMGALAAELAKRQGEVALLLARLGTPTPQRLTQVPAFRTMLDAGSLLVASGVMRAARGEGEMAVHHWLAAARLGRVVSDGSTGMPSLIEGMVGTAIEKQAWNALDGHARSGQLTPRQAALVSAELEHRAVTARTLEDYLAGEKALALCLLDRVVTEAGVPGARTETSLFRALLPVRRSDRAVFITELRAHLARAFGAIRARGHGNSYPKFEREEVSQLCGVAPFALDPWNVGRALFSRRRAVEFIGGIILGAWMSDYSQAGERLDQVQQLRAGLEWRCKELAQAKR